jgi:hypothetical protein
MASRLAAISSDPHIQEYAQGAAQSARMPMADFLAPTVEVSTMIGWYSVYDKNTRFRVPDTRRALGGDATQVRSSRARGTFNCEPHALDYPVDHLERIESEALGDVFREGADIISELAALDHEKTVVDAALAALGAGTGVAFTADVDPVATLDDAIMDVVKAAKYGSLMGVGVAMGASAWKGIKNHPKVQGKFVVGGRRAGNTTMPTVEEFGRLLLSEPDTRVSLMVYDDADEAAASEDIKFILDGGIIVFARKERPTRFDPSFMKTFRLRGQWMRAGSYMKEDGRGEVAKFDWSSDVKVTNSSAGKRINASF